MHSNFIAEKVRNPTRSALILLVLTLIVLIVVLGVDLMQRTRVYMVVNDSDNNEYFTKNDIVEIRGLEMGTEFTLKILLFGDFPIYELDGIA